MNQDSIGGYFLPKYLSDDLLYVVENSHWYYDTSTKTKSFLCLEAKVVKIKQKWFEFWKDDEYLIRCK